MSVTYKIILEGQEHEVKIEATEAGYELCLGGETHRFAPLLSEAPLYSFLIDDSQVLEADITFQKDHCSLNLKNLPYQMEVFDPRRRVISQSDGGDGDGTIAAPMPGKVIDVKVRAGDKIAKGEAAVIIEAMKMQNELMAAIDGVVKELHVKAGDTVEAGAKLVVIAKE